MRDITKSNYTKENIAGILIILSIVVIASVCIYFLWGR